MGIRDEGRFGGGVVWARVEDGFHVGSRNGEFLGYIDRQADGSYLACDGRSQGVGIFLDLRAAMSAVGDADPVALPKVG